KFPQGICTTPIAATKTHSIASSGLLRAGTHRTRCRTRWLAMTMTIEVRNQDKPLGGHHMDISRINKYIFLGMTPFLLGILIGHVNAEESLINEAEAYLKDHSDRNADSSWERSFHSRA